MPVTVTAKRALRSSKRKADVNNLIRNKLEVAIRIAKKGKKKADIKKAISLIDRATKKNILHRNRAARLKSSLSKATPKKIK